MKFIDLTGQKFGRLTAVSPVRVNNNIRWKCICECGGTTITSSTKLKSGHTQSCGCLQRERTSKSCRKDKVGQKFGKLTVLERIDKMGERAKYKCKCDCGNIVIVEGCNLSTGMTKSCGCIRKENTKMLKLSHGQCGTRLYKCWRNMINRCENPNNKGYKNYGNRGIKVCDEWHNFDEFYKWASSNGYKDTLTIERIDVNKGYYPNNCTWADNYTQARNRTDNVRLKFNGKEMILTDWAKEVGINYKTISDRLKRGWTVEEALTKK